MKNHINYSLLAIAVFLYFCSAKIEYLPQTFYGLTLSKKLTGESAKDFVNQLHFQNVTETDNEIGFYNGEKGKAIIYITYYASEEDAKKDEIRMTEKISPQNSVFINGEKLIVNGKSIYRTFGMGQSHYVFSHSNALFWISAETEWGIEFLEEYLNYIN